MTINNIKEDDNAATQLSCFKEAHNKKTDNDNDNKDKQAEKASWRIN
jgi:hypothetical protein